jgi:hypothetical protein
MTSDNVAYLSFTVHNSEHIRAALSQLSAIYYTGQGYLLLHTRALNPLKNAK